MQCRRFSAAPMGADRTPHGRLRGNLAAVAEPRRYRGHGRAYGRSMNHCIIARPYGVLPPEGGKRRVALTLRIESGERRGPFIDPAHGRRLVYDVSLPLRASGRRIPAFRTSERVFADTKRTKEKVGPKVPLRRSFDIESLGGLFFVVVCAVPAVFASFPSP